MSFSLALWLCLSTPPPHQWASSAQVFECAAWRILAWLALGSVFRTDKAVRRGGGGRGGG